MEEGSGCSAIGFATYDPLLASQVPKGLAPILPLAINTSSATALAKCVCFLSADLLYLLMCYKYWAMQLAGDSLRHL